MAPDHTMYLAENVINDKRTISYRILSRAMGVHVNQAKRMLYDFHERENHKKSGSVSAMYLVAGTKKSTRSNPVNGDSEVNGNGDINPSSPVMSSSMPQPAEEEDVATIKTITLVRGEELEDVKSSYETITSIHIYSLQPGRIQDLQTLTDLGWEIFANTFVKEDPLENYKKYGIIQNRNVKRRVGVKPPIPPVAAPQPTKQSTASTKGPISASSATKPQPPSSSSSGPFSKTATLKRTDSQDSNLSTASGTTKPPSTKRETSALFKSFAKTKPKPEKASSANVASDGDSVMKDASDDEGVNEAEEEALFLDTGKRTGGSAAQARVEKEERARKLRKMMEESDDEDAPTKKPTEVKGAPVKSEDQDEAEPTDWPSSPEPTSTKPEPEVAQPEPAAPTGPPGRRRGRRKVMKKRTMKDEEGYLVTKEEAVWESFSEDETTPAPAPVKKEPLPQKSKAGAGAAAGSTKPAATKGKASGNIMSFFSKK